MDFGVATSLVERRGGSRGWDAEEDVGGDGSGEEGWFLGYEGKGLSVCLGVEGRDVGAVEEDLAFLDGVEPIFVSEAVPFLSLR